MTKLQIDEMLRLHVKWLKNEPDGVFANLWGANLRNANLCGADLRNADLRAANLCGADLRNADLRAANLWGANLWGANLRNANLWGANLRNANLCGADLRNADLRAANLCGADLRNADLRAAFWNSHTSFYPLQCPESGSFVGWKKAQGYIVKLEICEDALRSSAMSRKCRCSKAKVLSIENLDGTGANLLSVPSGYDTKFIYTVGETVSVDNFDSDRWNECAPGIHFFITREEAVKYS